MTREILGRFFDWTLSLFGLGADAERRRAEEARARAEQETLERRKEEMRKKAKKRAAAMDDRRKLEAERDEAMRMKAKKRTAIDDAFELQFSTRVGPVENKIRELTDQNGSSSEVQHWKDQRDRIVEEIRQNYTTKLETLERETKKKILEFDRNIADIAHLW
jgi:hypothetical protein